MAMFVILIALAVVCIGLLAPLMLPGAVVVFAVLGIASLVRRHHAHAHEVVQSH